MKIILTIDAKALKARTDREIKRLAYNTALALNETAKVIQVEERINLEHKFTIRRSGFMQRLIKITQFASARKGNAFAEIAIDPTKARVLLGIFETGGVKQPAVGKSVAVPLTGGPLGPGARPSFSGQVIPALQIGKLRFHLQRRRGGAKPRWVGAQGTYIVPGVGIFQRIAGQKKSRFIYAFKKDPRLKKILGFIDIAFKKTAATQEWPKQFAKAYRKP